MLLIALIILVLVGWGLKKTITHFPPEAVHAPGHPSETHTEIFFDEGDPQDWHDYHGQERLKRFIQLQIDALPPHEGLKLMFIASAGRGKTTLFRIVANKLMQRRSGRYFELTPPMLRSKNSLDKFFRTLQQNDILALDECFTGDVQILTENGFVRFDQLPPKAKVAQYTDGGIEFVVPIRHIEKNYEGKMYRIHNRFCDLDMTANHEVLLFNNNKEEKKIPMAQVPPSTTLKFRVAAPSLHTDENELTELERLAIITQADGSLHTTSAAKGTLTYSFSFSKKRKLKRFEDFLQQSSFLWREVSCNRPGMKRFMVRGIPPTFSKNLWDHFDLTKISAKKARSIIDEAIHWDGSVYSDTGVYFSSADERQTDFYQAVAFLAGYKANKTIQVDSRKKSFRDVHRLFICKNKEYISLQGMKRNSYNYEGLVYCVTVPSGNIVVKRKGVPIITGNCHMLSRPIADTLLPAIEDGVYPFPEGMSRLPTGITWMGATTDVGLLPPAFQDRFQMMPLEDLSQEDMINILRDMGYPITVAAAEELTHRTLGSPRELKRLFRVARDVSSTKGTPHIGDTEIKHAFELLDLDHNGLYNHDRRILEALAHNPKYYAPRANGVRPKRYAHSERALRALTGIDEALYRDQIEPKLLKAGFITIGSGGRELTPKAFDTYFENLER